MARRQREKPDGLLYEPDRLSGEEEQALLERIESLRFDPIVIHGQAGDRDAPAFGTVVGISLKGAARLRFQRGKGDDRRVGERRGERPTVPARDDAA
jgi:hypothetical protein